MKIDPVDSEIAKIVVNYVPMGSVRGINFFNRKGIMVLAVGISNSINDYETKVINLLEGERILGVKSRLHTEGSALHNDLVFVVGWMQ